MHIRRLSAVVAALTMFAMMATASGAGADTAQAVPGPAAGSPLLTFVPPSVGPLTVSIGPTILDGHVMSPGVYVTMPGVTMPPITWTPPLGAWPPF